MIERLLTFSTSELCDGASNPRPMDYHIKPWVGEKRIAGRAVTVDVPAGEGDLIADAILQLKEGDVLVIAGKAAVTAPTGEISEASAPSGLRRPAW